MTVETTNEKNQLAKKEKDFQVNSKAKQSTLEIKHFLHFQNSLHIVYNDINYCTECLSNDSDEPFIIDSPTSTRDDVETWLSKVKVNKFIGFIL